MQICNLWANIFVLLEFQLLVNWNHTCRRFSKKNLQQACGFLNKQHRNIAIFNKKCLINMLVFCRICKELPIFSEFSAQYRSHLYKIYLIILLLCYQVQYLSYNTVINIIYYVHLNNCINKTYKTLRELEMASESLHGSFHGNSHVFFKTTTRLAWAIVDQCRLNITLVTSINNWRWYLTWVSPMHTWKELLITSAWQHQIFFAKFQVSINVFWL